MKVVSNCPGWFNIMILLLKTKLPGPVTIPGPTCGDNRPDSRNKYFIQCLDKFTHIHFNLDSSEQQIHKTSYFRVLLSLYLDLSNINKDYLLARVVGDVVGWLSGGQLAMTLVSTIFMMSSVAFGRH